MVQIGKTWQGELWFDKQLECLSMGKSRLVDHNNVKDIKFVENKVKAKVFKKSGDYQNVSIEFNQFSEDEKEAILNIIENNPRYVSYLSNNSLPYEFKWKLDRLGVDIVKEILDFTCDCYNFYGDPCSHVKDLIYQVAKIFDRDIFKFFELHGLDLKKEFDLKDTNSITKVDNFFKQDDDSEDEPIEIQPLDLGKVPRLDKKTLSMLDDNPIFYHKNFKSVLRKLLINFKNYGNEFIQSGFGDGYEDYIYSPVDHWTYEDFKKNFEIKWLNPREWNKLKIDINDDFSIESISGIDDLFLFDHEEYLIAFLAELHRYGGDVDEYNDEIRFLHQLFLFTLRIIKKMAIVPSLFRSDDHYFIRWMPAFYNPQINKFINTLSKMIPEGMVTYNGEEISRRQGVLALISQLLQGMLCFYRDVGISKELSKNFNKLPFDLFLGYDIDFDDDNDVYGFLVNNWISIFNYKYKDYDLYFEFKENDDIISFDLMVDNKRVHDVIKNKEDNYGNLISDIYLIEKYLPGVVDLIKTGELIEFDFDTFTTFLEDLMPIFKIMGVSILLPKSIQRITVPKLVLSQSQSSKDYINKEDLGSFNWEVALGDNVISISDFKKLVKGYKNIVKMANDYVILDKDDTISFVKKLGKLKKLNDLEVMQTVLTGEFDDVEVNIDNKLKNMFEDMLRFDEIQVPENVKVNLRDYQKTGFSWIVQNIKNGFGSILADDMGLGKTLQTLAAIQHFKQNGDLDDKKVLIVMPNGLLFNWIREIEKFTPELKAVIYHGTKRMFPEEDFDILLTSYGVLRSDVDIINQQDWFLMVIDEAQNIKNPRTKKTHAVKKIKADNKLALSGTPIENRLNDYWSIFDFTNPHYLPPATRFSKQYIKPIEKSKDESVLERFKTITSPFILRRLKTDKNIIDDLPDKIVNDIYCNLTANQAAMYQETLDSLLNTVNEETGMNRKGTILKLINSLKQICNHPSHFSKSNKYKISDSGKMEVLVDILENIMANDEKVIIFTQYVQMGNILKSLIEKHFKTNVGFLHGSLSKEEKDNVVQDFQEKPECNILIASIKTGGTGLNLTAAQNVIHYDLWWNPAVENQATDRAYRIGQKDNVMVYRLITSGTFEERINEMLKEKEELANLTVSTDQKFITEMNDQELAKILKLRREII